MQLTEKEAVQNYLSLKNLLMRKGDHFAITDREKLEADLAALEAAVRGFEKDEYTVYKTAVLVNTIELLLLHFSNLPGNTIGLRQGEESNYGLLLKMNKDVTANLLSQLDSICISEYDTEEPSINKWALIRQLISECDKLKADPPQNFIDLYNREEAMFFRIGATFEEPGK